MTKSEVAKKLAKNMIFHKTPKGTVFDPGSDVVKDCKWNDILWKHIISLIGNEEEAGYIAFCAYLEDHWNDSLPPKKT